MNENPELSIEDNERLEFLGDAVLDFIVGDYLYRRYPEMDEGGLTSLRAALVRAKTLADFSRQLDIGSALRLGYGEAENGGRERTPTLCAAFEAVVGALYLDQGIDVVWQLMNRLVPPKLEQIIADVSYKDAKSEFQVWSQGQFNVTPRYQVVGTEGPDHAKTFMVQVMLGDKVWGAGKGRSKQRAAQVAADVALTYVLQHNGGTVLPPEAGE